MLWFVVSICYNYLFYQKKKSIQLHQYNILYESKIHAYAFRTKSKQNNNKNKHITIIINYIEFIRLNIYFLMVTIIMIYQLMCVNLYRALNILIIHGCCSGNVLLCIIRNLVFNLLLRYNIRYNINIKLFNSDIFETNNIIHNK